MIRTDFLRVKEEFWNKAETRILNALQEFAEHVSGNSFFQRRMFAEDIVHGFGFFDLCNKKYDVVLMNPPFGETPMNARRYLKATYKEGRPDAYLCFIYRIFEFLKESGCGGAITSKTFMSNKFFMNIRKNIINKNLNLKLLADLGQGVLDGATVSTCAFIIEKTLIKNITIFFNVVNLVNRGQILLKLILDTNALKSNYNAIYKKLVWFSKIPGYILAYWIPNVILKTFASSEPLDKLNALQSYSYQERKNSEFHVRQGLIPGDLFRFTRLVSEVNKVDIGKKWRYACKGGSYRKYYYSEVLVLNWENFGKEIKMFAEENYGGSSRTIKNTQYFFKSGLTYPRISSIGFSMRFMTDNFIFTDAGPAIITENKNDQIILLGFLNSRLADFFTRIFDPGRKYEISHISSIPIISGLMDNVEIKQLSLSLLDSSIRITTFDETSEFFIKPLLLLNGDIKDENLLTVLNVSENHLLKEIFTIAKNQIELNQKIALLYGIDQSDQRYIDSIIQDIGTKPNRKLDTREILMQTAWLWPEQIEKDNIKLKKSEKIDFIKELISYIIGCIFGRWDIEKRHKNNVHSDTYATIENSKQFLFSNILIYSDFNKLYKNSIDNKNESLNDGYIFVDDSDNSKDIIHAFQNFLSIICSKNNLAIEEQMSSLIGCNSIRDYIKKPSGFFADHLKLYSRSRRQAPIYWPLSTASGSYTLWIYYHRLDDQLLYKCVVNFVDPKIADVTRTIETKQKEMSGAGTPAERKEIEQLQDFLQELTDFRNELLRVAELPYKPNLNDGVLITAAPLHSLFRLPKWKKDLENCWKKLETGEYDWAHLAYAIWPERVKEACKTDRSIAIAHDLEELYQEPEKKKKMK